MICNYCGKEFEKHKGSGRTPKYCSRECCQSADRDNKRINYIGKREKVCRQCGIELPKFKTKFCSRRCALINAGTIFDHGELTKSCIVCGKEFKTYKSKKLTCSDECKKKNANTHRRTKEQEREKYLRKNPDARTMEEIHETHLIRMERLEAEKAEAAERRKELKKELEKKQQKKAKIAAERKAYWQEYCKMHQCPVCKEMFVAYYPLTVYCSEKCKKKIRPRKKDRYNGITIDNDISLKILAIQDHDICQICGKKVNWDDWIERDGTIICGDDYPSIDHILPISRGGLHAWDNVQLAHRGCNTIKSDKVIS